MLASVMFLGGFGSSLASAWSRADGLNGKEKRFLEAVFFEPNLGDVDYTNVGDAELVAAGHAFCKGLKGINGEGAREGTGGPTPDDFDAVATTVAATRFSEVTKDFVGAPKANGSILLAYSVGIQAVKKMCKKYRSALG